MADPLKSWTSDPAPPPDEARAAELVKATAAIPARGVHAGDWENVLMRASRPNRAWPALALVATAMLVVVAAGLGWQRHNAPVVSASSEAKVVIDGQEITLSLGRLQISSSNPVKLVTPHVSLMLTGKVAADVDANRTLVEVDEGLAAVRAEGLLVELHAGQSRRWPTPPALPESLLEVPSAPAPSACDERPQAQRLDCLVDESRGLGLAAQVALYQRASLETTRTQANGAEVLWRESLRRFPNGVLHPEIRLSLLRQLLEERRFEAAAHEAFEFEQACPEDPRVGDVKKLRLMLEARLR